MSKYYTPDISEFVEGFEYQVKNKFRFDIWDASNPENIKRGKWQTSWVDRVVPNMDPVTYPYTIKNEDGTSWTFICPSFPDEDPLHAIKIMLENKNIRAKKINNN